jgi:hypothetical protein
MVISQARIFVFAFEKVFHPVGVPRVAKAIAQENHAAFEVSGLPGVQEMVRGGQGEYVAGVGGDSARLSRE